jgi:hypothetical protein
MLNRPLLRQRQKRFCEGRAHHHDDGAGFKQPLNLAAGDLSPPNDQATLTLQVDENRVIAKHSSVLTLYQQPWLRGGAVTAATVTLCAVDIGTIGVEPTD